MSALSIANQELVAHLPTGGDKPTDETLLEGVQHLFFFMIAGKRYFQLFDWWLAVGKFSNNCLRPQRLQTTHPQMPIDPPIGTPLRWKLLLAREGD